MTLSRDEILAQIDAVLADVRRLDLDRSPGEFREEAAMAVTRLAAVIDRLAPEPSQYRARANNELTTAKWDKFRIPGLIAALTALRLDVEQGYVESLEARVREAVFDDFLEMAEHLRHNVHEAPAAVVAGAVLEQHLHKLAADADVSIVDDKGRPRSVEQIGIDLVKQSVFSEPQRKVIAGWYGQRTEAAHGRFDNVIPAQVEAMIPGIRDFIARHPA